MKPLLGIDEIRRILPHRPPMLLVDRVLEISEGRIVAEKLVSANEPFLTGHFPENPVMPGVLIAEALAQTAGLGAMHLHPELRGKGVALVGLDNWRFRRPVVPGDVLVLLSQLVRRRANIFIAEAKAQVLSETVASGQVMAAFIEWEGK